MIEHAGLIFRVPAEGTESEERLLYLGDDDGEVALEVMAVELESGELYVIHAMEMRERYRPQYEEAKKWRVSKRNLDDV